MRPQRTNGRIPKLRTKKIGDRTYAMVTLNRKDIYLKAKPSTPEAQTEYDLLVAQWLNRGCQGTIATSAESVSVAEILSGYLKAAEEICDGMHRSTLDRRYRCIQVLLEAYGSMQAIEFRPSHLIAVRDTVITRGKYHGTNHPDSGKPLSRSTVNYFAWLVVEIFRWAASREMLPESIYRQLQSVETLQAPPPRSTKPSRVSEPKAVDIVEDWVVEATLPYLSKPLQAVVQMQRITGARQEELLMLRSIDIDFTDPMSWLYKPAHHKTERYGQTRPIFFGPKCQELLKPFFTTNPRDYLFRPADGCITQTRWKMPKIFLRKVRTESRSAYVCIDGGKIPLGADGPNARKKYDDLITAWKRTLKDRRPAYRLVDKGDHYDAVVKVFGSPRYLGRGYSPESYKKYEEWMTKWQAWKLENPPKYNAYKPSAATTQVVKIDGKRHHLGPAGDPSVQQKYAELTKDLQPFKRKPSKNINPYYKSHNYTGAVASAARRADHAAHLKSPETPADIRIVPHWHPHQLRHSAATDFYNQFDTRVAMELLGHTSEQTTKKYINRSKDIERAARVMAEVG